MSREEDLLDLIDHARREGDQQTADMALGTYHKEFTVPQHQARLSQAETDLAGVKGKQHPMLEQLGEATLGTGDAITSVLSSAASTPIIGATGLFSRALNGVSGRQVIDPNKAKQAVAEKITWQPQSTQAKATMNVLGAPGRVVSDASTAAVNALSARSPTAGKIADATLGTLGDVIAAYPAKSAIDATVSNLNVPSRTPPREMRPANVMETTSAEGIPLRPSDVVKAGGKAPVGAVLEKLGGSGKMRADLLEPTQLKIDALAKRSIGIPETTARLTPDVFDAAKAPHNAVYGKVAARIGKVKNDGRYTQSVMKAGDTMGASPEATATIDKIRSDYADISGKSANDLIAYTKKLRKDANRDFKAGNDTVASARMEISSAIETLLEKNADRIGQPGLVNEFRNARRSLAKIYTVEGATEAGRVNAADLKKMAWKDVPLSGDLKTIADASEYFPHTTKSPLSMADSAPKSSPLDTAVNIASFGLKPLAQKGIRAALESKAYQSRLAPMTGMKSFAGKGPTQWPASMMPKPPEPVAPSPGNLELAPPYQTSGIPFSPSRSPMAPQMAGNLSLVEDAPYAPLANALAKQKAGRLKLPAWNAESSPNGPFAYTKGMPYNPPASPSPVVNPSFPQLLQSGKLSPRDLSVLQLVEELQKQRTQ